MTGAEKIRQKKHGCHEQRLQKILRAVRKKLYAALEDRGVSVPDHLRARIDGCVDFAQLTAWLRRATTAAIREPSE